MGISNVLWRLLFPPRCVFCRRILPADGICDACQEKLPWLEEARAERRLEFVEACVSPLRYRDQVRKSIHRYKFQGVRSYANVYGKLIAQCVEDHLRGEYDLISWAPLSDRRRRKRGYDQAFLLADVAAKALGTEAVPTLRKSRDTHAQSGITDEAARRANVLGVYRCSDPALVAGKRVLLIDDVVTTGATLSECARVLRTAGAAGVVCATLARAK